MNIYANKKQQARPTDNIAGLIPNWAMAALLILALSACQMPSPTNSSSSPSGGGSAGGGSAGGGSAGGGSAGGDSSAGDSSGGESIEGLDEALDASLDNFDDSVLGGGSSGTGDIDILSPTGSSGGVDSDEPLFEEGGEGASDSSAAIEQRAAEGAPPGADGAAGAAGANQAGASQAPEDGEIIPLPDDIDDGQGDDIVLRQIRDAATKERDPVLREKLWDEYRRIKNQG
ncbi:hypothetical protein OAI12_02745 [Porticoccaceae bacterium]|nr:hypothetical protein [Porticoccaceae bacterium]